MHTAEHNSIILLCSTVCITQKVFCLLVYVICVTKYLEQILCIVNPLVRKTKTQIFPCRCLKYLQGE